MIYESNSKLDLKTRLFLYIRNVKIVNHTLVIDEGRKRKFTISSEYENEVYVFKDYEEYKNFFLMYFYDIDEDLINTAIYTKGANGQIVAFKKLCSKIIINKKISEASSYYTKERIEEIHKKGKLTPSDMIREWESLDLCAPSDINRCKYFEHDCHECLTEYAYKKGEYNKMEYKVTNGISNSEEIIKTDNKEVVRKLIKK